MEIKQYATELENTWRQMKMEIHHTKHVEYSKRSSRKEVHRNAYIKKQGKISNKQSNFVPKGTGRSPKLMEGWK